MIESQRQAYLEAMDINVWVSKSAIDDSIRLILGPGSGSTLLLCRDAGEPSSQIASDISRYLGGNSIWAWPDAEQNPASPSVKDAVDQRLITRVIVFGIKLAEQLFDGAVPQVVRSAQTVVSADLDELALSGLARKSLWCSLSDSNPAAGI